MKENNIKEQKPLSPINIRNRWCGPLKSNFTLDLSVAALTLRALKGISMIASKITSGCGQVWALVLEPTQIAEGTCSYQTLTAHVGFFFPGCSYSLMFTDVQLNRFQESCWSLALTMTPLRQGVISVLPTDYDGQSLKGNFPQFGNNLTHQSLFTGLWGKYFCICEKKKKKRLLFYNSRGSCVKFESQCDKKKCGNAEPKRSKHARIIELTWHLWLRLATRGCVSCY